MESKNILKFLGVVGVSAGLASCIAAPSEPQAPGLPANEPTLAPQTPPTEQSPADIALPPEGGVIELATATSTPEPVTATEPVVTPPPEYFSGIQGVQVISQENIGAAALDRIGVPGSPDRLFVEEYLQKANDRYPGYNFELVVIPGGGAWELVSVVNRTLFAPVVTENGVTQLDSALSVKAALLSESGLLPGRQVTFEGEFRRYPAPAGLKGALGYANGRIYWLGVTEGGIPATVLNAAIVEQDGPLGDWLVLNSFKPSWVHTMRVEGDILKAYDPKGNLIGVLGGNGIWNLMEPTPEAPTATAVPTIPAAAATPPAGEGAEVIPSGIYTLEVTGIDGIGYEVPILTTNLRTEGNYVFLGEVPLFLNVNGAWELNPAVQYEPKYAGLWPAFTIKSGAKVVDPNAETSLIPGEEHEIQRGTNTYFKTAFFYPASFVGGQVHDVVFMVGDGDSQSFHTTHKIDLDISYYNDFGLPVTSTATVYSELLVDGTFIPAQELTKLVGIGRYSVSISGSSSFVLDIDSPSDLTWKGMLYGVETAKENIDTIIANLNAGGRVGGWLSSATLHSQRNQ